MSVTWEGLPVKQYIFVWSPEGREIASYVQGTGWMEVRDRAHAVAKFQRKFRDSYAKYMGEVYVKEEIV